MLILNITCCCPSPLQRHRATTTTHLCSNFFPFSPSSTIAFRLPPPPNISLSVIAKANRGPKISGGDIEDDDTDFASRGRFGGSEKGKDFERDPEFAEIVGSFFVDPQKAQSKLNERVRKKRDKIVQTKTGSSLPMKVTFNKFNYSNSYVWFEFYNIPLEKDVSLICDTLHAWHIVGRLGGFNSMNMQLAESAMDSKRPRYDAIQGANVTPTTFYNIGDLEVQDNLARVWVDIGTSEPLILDALINALTQISSDYIGIKQLVFGGSKFEYWKEDLTSEYSGYSIHKI